MKNLQFLRLIILVILSIAFQVNLLAQDYSQLKLLPVPNEKVINFINPDVPVITDLPVHPFDFGGSPGNPHDEDQLLWADLDMEYDGQHPMFAQTLIHDKDGNLLFFIVDNNIYNRFGEKFYKNYTTETAYLHDGTIDPSPQGNSSYHSGITGDKINRFFNQSEPRFINSEIIIAPVQNSCYTYHIIYSLQSIPAGGHDAIQKTEILYRTITFQDDENIILTPSVNISRDISSSYTGCCQGNKIDLALSTYRVNENNENRGTDA